MVGQLQQEHEDITKWVAEGLYTPDAILSRSTELWDEIQPRIASLISESSNQERLSENAFIAHLQRQDRSFESEDGINAAKIVFASMRYLAKVPLISEPSHPDGLTARELSLAATWLFLTHTSDYSNQSRTRTPADYRRILFQSLAVLDDRLTHNPEDWHQYALHNAVAGLDPFYVTEYTCNRDDDGDELYHDVVDVLCKIQPERWSRYGPMGDLHRDEWRGLAKRLHNTDVRLHQLSIPMERFRTLVRMLLPARWDFGSRPVSQRAGAESRRAAECILSAFGQDPEGITWPTFNDALKNVAPHLLNPMLRNLAEIVLGGISVNTDFWGAIEDDPMEAPRPGIIASPALLDQLATIFSAQQLCEFRCTKYWVGADKPSAATLFAELTQSMQQRRSVIFLIGGVLVGGGGRCIFGASKGVASPWLQNELDQGRTWAPVMMPISAKLFQLYPVQDVFLEGDFVLVDGSLRFEATNSLAFMSLNPASDGGCVDASREITGSNALSLSQSRQRGLVRFKVQEIEMWEQFDYNDDE